VSGTIYKNEYRKLVNRLKQARLEAALTQKEVSKHLGKCQSYVSKIESGQLMIDILTLKKIAKIYKKPIEFFIN
jgi:transcriptional regulator with XRE-family HTH domain